MHPLFHLFTPWPVPQLREVEEFMLSALAGSNSTIVEDEDLMTLLVTSQVNIHFPDP